jgi:hypothetical protein
MVPMIFVLKSQNTRIATFFSSQNTTLSLSLLQKTDVVVIEVVAKK